MQRICRLAGHSVGADALREDSLIDRTAPMGREAGAASKATRACASRRAQGAAPRRSTDCRNGRRDGGGASDPLVPVIWLWRSSDRRHPGAPPRFKRAGGHRGGVARGRRLRALDRRAGRRAPAHRPPSCRRPHVLGPRRPCAVWRVLPSKQTQTLSARRCPPPRLTQGT
jgi:hypothetical protein